MRACEEYIDLMMQDIDGEISQQDQAALYAHLQQCEACKAIYQAYRDIDRGIRETGEEPPEQLTAAIMNSIHREKPQPKQWFRRYRFTAIAAAAAVVVLISAKIGGNYASRSDDITRNSDVVAGAAVMPEVAAEFHEGAGETAYSAAVKAAAEEAEGAVEDPAGQEETGADDAMEKSEPQIVAEAEEVEEPEEDRSFLACVEALRNAGYAGASVLCVTDASREELEQAIPDMTELTLEDGFVLYEIKESDVETVLTQFRVPSDYTSDSDGQGRYFIYLKP